MTKHKKVWIPQKLSYLQHDLCPYKVRLSDYLALIQQYYISLWVCSLYVDGCVGEWCNMLGCRLMLPPLFCFYLFFTDYPVIKIYLTRVGRPRKRDTKIGNCGERSRRKKMFGGRKANGTPVRPQSILPMNL